MSKLKTFWLDPDKDYTRQELRDLFSGVGVGPWNSFIVYYKGLRCTVPCGNKNIEEFICQIIPDRDERFTGDSPYNVTPRLEQESSDRIRLKYGIEFKSKFISESEYDKFLYRHLDMLDLHEMLPEDLSDDYRTRRRGIMYLAYMCRGRPYREEKDSNMDKLKKEIIEKYKIAIKAYDAEKSLRKRIDRTLENHKYNPELNCIISVLTHLMAIFLFRVKYGSEEVFWILATPGVAFILLSILLLQDGFSDNYNGKMTNRNTLIYEIFTDASAIITMIMIFINFPQLINIGGRFMEVFLNKVINL